MPTTTTFALIRCLSTGEIFVAEIDTEANAVVAQSYPLGSFDRTDLYDDEGALIATDADLRELHLVRFDDPDSNEPGVAGSLDRYTVVRSLEAAE